MSPVSRGRKKKRPAATNRRAERTEPGLDGLYRDMVRGFRPLVTASNPLDAETFMSGMLGVWWQKLPPDVEPDELELGAVAYAASRRTSEALALLSALAAVGESGQVREAAGAAARDLEAAGVRPPPWADGAGWARPTACWWSQDVFGDQAEMLCVFDGAAGPHGLVVLVDLNQLGGWVKDVFVTDEPDEVLGALRDLGTTDRGMRPVEPLDPGEAHRLLVDAFDATDLMWEPDVGEDFRDYRALALARCRCLPEPSGAVTLPPEVTEAERAAIVDEFLASPHAAGLPGEVARTCARLVVDYGAERDRGRPLRASPAKAEMFLLWWLPREVVLEERERAAMPAVVAAWMRWAGERAGLDPEVLAELDEVCAESGAVFAETYDDLASDAPSWLYLGEHPRDSDDAAEVLARRRFAAPSAGTRIGDEDFPRLDPGDPDERRLLVMGEHPEYQAALDDAGFDGDVDGVDPLLHVTLHEILASQLWDDDPPEVWQAAQRLLETGAERHDVLHALADVLARHLYAAMTGEDPGLTAYRKDVAALP
ncbi:MAG TPA: DUF1841 family protein [Frankiaceae bacterium]|nr:DUF1841 family protein [Frankiaceae bacterium]